MRQDLPCMCMRWSALLALFLALGVGREAVAAPATVATPIVMAKTDGTVKAKPKAKRRRLRQYTGVVTTLNETSLTIEKPGKKPRSRVFVRTKDLKVKGELVKHARATVYYREHDGEYVAHRVVVKSDPDDEE